MKYSRRIDNNRNLPVPDQEEPRYKSDFYPGSGPDQYNYLGDSSRTCFFARSFKYSSQLAIVFHFVFELCSQDFCCIGAPVWRNNIAKYCACAMRIFELWLNMLNEDVGWSSRVVQSLEIPKISALPSSFHNACPIQRITIRGREASLLFFKSVHKFCLYTGVGVEMFAFFELIYCSIC